MNVVIPMLALTVHGGNRVLFQIANFLSKKGHKVTLVTTTTNQTPFELSESVKIKVIFDKIKNKHVRFLFFLLFGPFFFRGDVIISNHFLTYFPSQISTFFSRGKNVFFVQGIESECFNDYNLILRMILSNINRRSFRSKNVVTANPYLSKRVEKYTTISHEFNLGISRRWLKKSTSEKVYDVIYYARDEANKGLDRFYQIYHLNPDLSYLCISQNEKLLDSLSSLDSIDVYMPKSDAEIYNLIDKSRVLLLTSYKEGFALPPLEAMFRGVPFIYFECGGPSVYANSRNSSLINTCSEFKLCFNEINISYDDYSIACMRTAEKFVLEESLIRFNDYILSL
ncbi:glycosyltransferase [Vibrio alginolyticus]|uniref:glycosyltransferase n=1 Tax=Vibrio alginolyticus TaxID=663 RepID=UPI002FF371C7